MKQKAAVASESAFWLFLASSTIGLYGLWREGSIASPEVVSVTLAIPCLAAIGIWLLAFVVPSVFAVDTIRFPLNITLPILHFGLSCLALTLVSNLQHGLQGVIKEVKPALVWFEPAHFGSAIVLQVVALSVLAGSRRSE